MIYDSETIIGSGIMLQDADFPRNFVNQKHPDDYNEFTNPITEIILHRKTNHNRLILRISFLTDEGYYIPISFICDTGAPGCFYFSEASKLSKIGQLIKKDECENDYIKIGNKRFPVSETPSHHPYINIIGLRLLLHLGLCLSEQEFYFTNLPEYF